MVIQYDTVEFLKEGISLGKTCLPEFSDDIIRIALAKHIGAYPYDELWIHRQDSSIYKIKLSNKISG